MRILPTDIERKRRCAAADVLAQAADVALRRRGSAVIAATPEQIAFSQEFIAQLVAAIAQDVRDGAPVSGRVRAVLEGLNEKPQAKFAHEM